jgi:hypothetical protein
MHGTNGIKSPLSRKAVLVSLNISSWTARKFDRKVTDKVNKEAHASGDAGRYNKLLVEASRLKGIQSVATEAREKFYRYTRPWADGVGILPNVSYQKFSNEMRVLKQRYAEEADKFAKEFRNFVAERQNKLGSIFDPNDYPSEKEIRSKFSFETSFANVPDAGDFRSDVLDDETVADIRAEISASENKAEQEIMNHTYQQIAEVVGNMAKKLSEYKVVKDTHFKDTLVSNIRELTELLPTFNLTGDAKLTEITKRLQSELCVEDPKTLRDNADVRAVVQKSAEEILAQVESVMA